MKNSKKQVLIVGAGLAGLSIYLALNKEKFDVEIIEKRKKFEQLGYSLIFMPLGVKALKYLGFTVSDISALGKNIKVNNLMDKNGKLVMTTDFRPLVKKFDKYMMITRERLYKLLKKKIPAKNIHFGLSLKSISSNKSTKINVKFTDLKQKEYDIVIGADGIHSCVRYFLFPNIKLNPLDISIMWAWIPRKIGIYPNQHGAIGDENFGVGFFNSGEKTKSCMAFFLQKKEIPSNLTPKDYRSFLRKYFKNFKGPVPKILNNLPSGNEMYLHNDYEFDMKKWHKGNVVLIGDSAHARSAFSGAGSTLAIEDAIVLGHYLNKEHEVEKAINKYEKKQRVQVDKLSMSKLKLYLQNQKGIPEYLENIFNSSFLYSKENK